MRMSRPLCRWLPVSPIHPSGIMRSRDHTRQRGVPPTMPTAHIPHRHLQMCWYDGDQHWLLHHDAFHYPAQQLSHSCILMSAGTSIVHTRSTSGSSIRFNSAQYQAEHGHGEELFVQPAILTPAIGDTARQWHGAPSGSTHAQSVCSTLCRGETGDY